MNENGISNNMQNLENASAEDIPYEEEEEGVTNKPKNVVLWIEQDKSQNAPRDTLRDSLATQNIKNDDDIAVRKNKQVITNVNELHGPLDNTRKYVEITDNGDRPEDTLTKQQELNERIKMCNGNIVLNNVIKRKKKKKRIFCTNNISRQDNNLHLRLADGISYITIPDLKAIRGKQLSQADSEGPADGRRKKKNNDRNYMLDENIRINKNTGRYIFKNEHKVSKIQAELNLKQEKKQEKNLCNMCNHSDIVGSSINLKSGKASRTSKPAKMSEISKCNGSDLEGNYEVKVTDIGNKKLVLYEFEYTKPQCSLQTGDDRNMNCCSE